MTRDRALDELTRLIFVDPEPGGGLAPISPRADEIVRVVLAALDDPDIAHLYFEGVRVEEACGRAAEPGGARLTVRRRGSRA